jgi:histidinol-phosphate aminotransferase
MPNTSRRQWIQQTTLAALGLGFSFRSMGNEDGLQKIFSPESNLINLGANENPYGISAKAKQAILDMMGESNRYQFNVPSLQGFKKRLASYYNVTEEHILITPGSGEGLNLLARHFSKGNIIAPDITFGVLPNTAKKIGTKVIEVPLSPSKVHDLRAMLSVLNKETPINVYLQPCKPFRHDIKTGYFKKLLCGGLKENSRAGR